MHNHICIDCVSPIWMTSEVILRCSQTQFDWNDDMRCANIIMQIEFCMSSRINALGLLMFHHSLQIFIDQTNLRFLVCLCICFFLGFACEIQTNWNHLKVLVYWIKRRRNVFLKYTMHSGCNVQYSWTGIWGALSIFCWHFYRVFSRRQCLKFRCTGEGSNSNQIQTN